MIGSAGLLRSTSTGLSAEQAHHHREPDACCQQRRFEGLPSATTEAVAYESLSEVAARHQGPQHLQACRSPHAATCRHDGGETACDASRVIGAENAVPLKIESRATLSGVPFTKPTSYA
jgi:hypothetical protein